MNHHLSLMPVNNVFRMKKKSFSIFKEIIKLWNTITEESLFQWIVQLETNNSPIELFETKVNAHNFDEWLQKNSLKLYRIILQLDVVNPLKLPLHLCIQKGALHVAKVLIEDGEDLETKDSFGQTPLHLASMKGLTNIVRVLLENGANVNSIERNGLTSCFLAVRAIEVDTLRLLLLHGANPNVVHNHFGQPIHLAVKQNCMNIAKILVQSGSTIDVRLKAGYETPVEYGLLKKKIKAFKIMIHNSNF